LTTHLSGSPIIQNGKTTAGKCLQRGHRKNTTKAEPNAQKRLAQPFLAYFHIYINLSARIRSLPLRVSPSKLRKMKRP
jgi:hypothetical protein